MMQAGEKAKDFKGTIRKLAQYLSVYKWSILIVVIFAIASTIFAIVGPKILGKATTKLFEGVMNMVRGTGEGIDFAYIAQILLFLLGIYAVSSLFSYIQGYIMTGVSMKVTYNMRKEISDKVQRLPFSYYDKTNKGEVLSHITNDVDAISPVSSTHLDVYKRQVCNNLYHVFHPKWSHIRHLCQSKYLQVNRPWPY